MPPKLAPTQVVIVPILKGDDVGPVLEKAEALRMEIGPRDMEQEQVVLAKRVRAEDDPRKEFLPEAEALATIPERLDALQAQLLEDAIARREQNSYRGVETIGELAEILDGSGGYVYTGWSGDPAVEERIKEETKGTLRCIPSEEFRSAEAPTKCIGGEGDATMEVVWSRAY